MGLGKTVEAIVLDLTRRAELLPHETPKTLVVTPLPVVSSWAKHWKTWSPYLKVVTIDNKNRQPFIDAVKRGDGDVFICHWPSLRLMPELADVRWFHVIGDEIHAIQNRKTKQTRAFKKIKSDYKTGLSGTPAFDKPDDLWSILNWLYPQYWSSYWKYFDKHVMYAQYNGYKQIIGVAKVEELQREMAGFYLRRKKEEVLPDLPDKYYCTPPETPILMSNLSFKKISEIVPGDEVFGWSDSEGTGKRQKLVPSVVKSTGSLRSTILAKVTMKSGHIVKCTPDHKWKNGCLNSNTWVSFQVNQDNRLSVAKALSFAIDVPRELSQEESELALWLGGIIDGEGSFHSYANGTQWSIYQSLDKNKDVHSRIKLALETLEIPFYFTRGGNEFKINVSRESAMKIIYWCKPVKNESLWHVFNSAGFTRDDVSKIEYEFGDHEVFWLETETGNYIAWGFGSKNSEIEVELDPMQMRAYESMRKNMIAWVGQHEKEPLTAPVVIAQLTRLQQFSDAFAEIIEEDDGTIRVVLSEPSSKLDAVMEIIDECDGQVVVFSQFSQMIKLLKARLEKEGIAHGIYVGGTPEKERTRIVEEFQAGNLKVFAGTISAGGVGITLTASSTIVFIDRGWSPSINKQAEDRLHRIGQENAVQVVDIRSRDTLDVKRAAQIALKWSWIRQLIGDD